MFSGTVSAPGREENYFQHMWGMSMIDEKKVIKKLQSRIDDFVLKHPDKKDCEAVQTVEEFIQMLEEEAEKAQLISE